MDFDKILREGLAASPIFGVLPENDITALCTRFGGCGGFRTGTFSDGEDIPFMSDGEGALGIVLSGSVSISRADETGRVVLNTLHTGGCFGASALFADRKRRPPTQAVSVGESAVAFIGDWAFAELLAQSNELSMSYIRFLTNRICFLNDKLNTFSGANVNERVAKALLTSPTAREGCYSGSMAELARRLNIGRASLYRALDAMEEKKLIKRGGKYIELLDAEALACFR